MTSEDRRERYLASQRRYNLSDKGRRRDQRYEIAHPERAGRGYLALSRRRQDAIGIPDRIDIPWPTEPAP